MSALRFFCRAPQPEHPGNAYQHGDQAAADRSTLRLWLAYPDTTSAVCAKLIANMSLRRGWRLRL